MKIFEVSNDKTLMLKGQMRVAKDEGLRKEITMRITPPPYTLYLDCTKNV